VLTTLTGKAHSAEWRFAQGHGPSLCSRWPVPDPSSLQSSLRGSKAPLEMGPDPTWHPTAGVPGWACGHARQPSHPRERGAGIAIALSAATPDRCPSAR
jgi:hypothetical protein